MAVNEQSLNPVILLKVLKQCKNEAVTFPSLYDKDKEIARHYLAAKELGYLFLSDTNHGSLSNFNKHSLFVPTSEGLCKIDELEGRKPQRKRYRLLN
jgi:hypothetical protein